MMALSSDTEDGFNFTDVVRMVIAHQTAPSKSTGVVSQRNIACAKITLGRRGLDHTEIVIALDKA